MMSIFPAAASVNENMSESEALSMLRNDVSTAATTVSVASPPIVSVCPSASKPKSVAVAAVSFGSNVSP